MSYRNTPTPTRVCVCDVCGAKSDQARGASDFWYMADRPLHWAEYRRSRASKSVVDHLCPVCVEKALAAMLQGHYPVAKDARDCPNGMNPYGPEVFAPMLFTAPAALKEHAEKAEEDVKTCQEVYAAARALVHNPTSIITLTRLAKAVGL